MGECRRRIRVGGIVQGVGFRPAMHRLASSLGLHGFVGNDGTGVFIEIEGTVGDVEGFVTGLRGAAPPLAAIDEVIVETLDPRGDDRFVIVESDPSGPRSTLLAPDIAPCDACLAELADRSDRRYRYPFLNCTDCGPRYSIVRALPYDRAATTMSGFQMCDRCAAEYHDPGDRRFHAQPTCCPACGPSLSLRTRRGPVDCDDALTETVRQLHDGAIVAVKGLGGYHLAVDARNEPAVARLRARKHREDKPFALLVTSLDDARALAAISPTEADLLVDPSRPIVLVERAGGEVAPSVAPGNRSLGVLLPPTPLHVLLAQDFGGPLVLTSGNRSSEPIVTDDRVALDRLGDIADAFCTHDRPIHVRVDDSVSRVVADHQIVVRRARGLAPRPVRVKPGFPRHVLAVGAQLKSTVCLARDDLAFVSEHLGDLENLATYESFTRAIGHLSSVFGVEPAVVVHDLHPDMTSTAHALSIDGVEHVGVQHHHAHIASCLADNDRDGPVIGVAFDGLGFGEDGSLWGGEVLRCDRASSVRLGHLGTVAMPGGDVAVQEPWRLAVAHLAEAVGVDVVELLDVHRRNRERWQAVASMVSSGVSAPPTSSVGRLFDAVAAIVGVRDTVTYEGQAAIELEQAADPDEDGTYPVEIRDGDPFVIDAGPLVRSVVADVRAAVPVGVIAARFHNGVVDLTEQAVLLATSRTGLRSVALSGGVFQNALLVERATRRLAAIGLDVLTHRRIPANDGGISLGQAVIAAARDLAADPI